MQTGFRGRMVIAWLVAGAAAGCGIPAPVAGPVQSGDLWRAETAQGTRTLARQSAPEADDAVAGESQWLKEMRSLREMLAAAAAAKDHDRAARLLIIERAKVKAVDTSGFSERGKADHAKLLRLIEVELEPHRRVLLKGDQADREALAGYEAMGEALFLWEQIRYLIGSGQTEKLMHLVVRLTTKLDLIKPLMRTNWHRLFHQGLLDALPRVVLDLGRSDRDPPAPTSATAVN